MNKSFFFKIEDFNMVQFLPLDVTDEDSVGLILSHIDNAIQYGEAEVNLSPTTGFYGYSIIWNLRNPKSQRIWTMATLKTICDHRKSLQVIRVKLSTVQ